MIIQLQCLLEYMTKKKNNTIPYYSEFYEQTFDVIEQCNFSELKWLDLGCGTGRLDKLANERFHDPQFVLVDPSEKMLEKEKEKLECKEIEYICGDDISRDMGRQKQWQWHIMQDAA